MYFDNHNQPNKDAQNEERFSRISAFKVDQQNMTVERTWNFVAYDKKFSFYMGSGYMQKNGNILGTWPTSQYACEIDYKTGKVVWESEFKPKNTSGDVYRTYKVNQYDSYLQ